MNHPKNARLPPGEHAWDITFTRIAFSVLPQVEACMFSLARRFCAMGLTSDTQVRQTPRGQSVFLSLIGRYGLAGIVDCTLVDGMAVGQGPAATLDTRLLDACGDVVAIGLTNSVRIRHLQTPPPAQGHVLENLDRAATGIYVEALAQFNLLRSPVGNG
jgi:hypothetical protein